MSLAPLVHDDGIKVPLPRQAQSLTGMHRIGELDHADMPDEHVGYFIGGRPHIENGFRPGPLPGSRRTEVNSDHQLATFAGLRAAAPRVSHDVVPNVAIASGVIVMYMTGNTKAMDRNHTPEVRAIGGSLCLFIS